MLQIIKDVEQLQQVLSAFCWLVLHFAIALRWIRDRWGRRHQAHVGTAPGDDRQPVAHGAVALMRYPFPLRGTVDAWLEFPRDLTKEEADRLSIFITSLVQPDTASPTSP